MSSNPADLAYRRHTQTITAGDHESWCNSFAEDAVVEGPVGISPLDRFDPFETGVKQFQLSGTPCI